MPNDALTNLKKISEATDTLTVSSGAAPKEEVKESPIRRFLNFWVLVIRSFHRNRCPARASALAYTTLLAFIPLLAVGVSVTSSLLQKQGDAPVRAIIDRLVGNSAPALNLEVKDDGGDGRAKREEVVQRITGFINTIHSGALGVTSTIALVFVAIGLLRTIESTFNDIWGVTRGRSWIASTIQYWAAITLGTVALVLVAGLTSGPHFTSTATWIESWPWVGTVVFGLLPFVVLSGAFTVLYLLMPNTKVHWSAALIGGVVGGSLWQLNSKLNVLYVSKVVTFSKIYGSLGIILLFLAGLYLSWLILLFGAQVAYSFQNRQAYLQEKQAGSVNQRGREFVALRIMTHLGRQFHAGERGPNVAEIAAGLAVPSQAAAAAQSTHAARGMARLIESLLP